MIYKVYPLVLIIYDRPLNSEGSPKCTNKGVVNLILNNGCGISIRFQPICLPHIDYTSHGFVEGYFEVDQLRLALHSCLWCPLSLVCAAPESKRHHIEIMCVDPMSIGRSFDVSCCEQNLVCTAPLYAALEKRDWMVASQLLHKITQLNQFIVSFVRFTYILWRFGCWWF